MDIKASVENGKVPVTVMHVTGNIDSATHEAFAAKADELIQNGARHILVDLSQTAFISSAGLRALHIIIKRLRSLYPDIDLSEAEYKKRISTGTYKSSHIKLLNLSEETQIAFTLSGFDIHRNVYRPGNSHRILPALRLILRCPKST